MIDQWVVDVTPEVNALSKYPIIIAVCIALTVLMLLAICMRMYVRMFMIKSVGIDDYVMIFTCFCSIVYNALCLWQSRLGLGLPIALRPKTQLHLYTVVNYAGRPFYMAGITGFKVALCFAYLRITSAGQKSKYRLFIWLFMAFTILSHLAGTLVLIFQCNPIEKTFNRKLPGKCLKDDITFYALASVTIFCDVIIFIAPIPLFLKIQIDLRRKAGLIFIFLLGLFTTVCSVLRMVQIITISKTGDSTMLVLWGTVEMNVGIILTCLPTLTPLITFFRERTRYGSYKYGSDKTPGGSYRMNKFSKDRSNQFSSRSFASGPKTHHKDSDSYCSAEKILQPTNGPYITKTTEVHMTENSRSQCNSTEPRKNSWE